MLEPVMFTMLAGIYLGDESDAKRSNLWVWLGSHRVQRLFEEKAVDALMSEAAGPRTSH